MTQSRADIFKASMIKEISSKTAVEWSNEVVLVLLTAVMDRTWEEAREIGYSEGYDDGSDDALYEDESDRGENVWPLR